MYKRQVLGNACLKSKNRFYKLFTTWDTAKACGKSQITTITPATDSTGLASSSYIENSGSNSLNGSGSNGWCWNGGDNNSNIFKGHAGWNQSSYSNCYESGHLGYVGVFSNSSSQYSNADITGTNWLESSDYSKTGVSFYAR